MGSMRAAVVTVALAFVALTMTVFYVDQRELAVKFRFGEIVDSEFEPGLHFKIPIVNNVQFFPKRILTINNPQELFLTFEKKNLLVDFFVKWRIIDVADFYRATRGEQLMYFETFPIKEVLQHGLVPVVYGDVSVDANQGMSIVSTETLFDNLARELTPDRVILAGQVDAVYEADPLADPAAELIDSIDSSNWEEVEAMLSGSHGVDVTGGMFSKVREMYRLTLAMPPMQAMIMSAEEPGHLEMVLKGQMVDFGTLIN